MAGVRTLKTVTLAAAVYFYDGLTMGGSADPVCTIIFVCATISSIAGFAFSAISGSMLLHVVRDPVEAVQDAAPDIDEDRYRLIVDGLIENKQPWTLEQLNTLPQETIRRRRLSDAIAPSRQPHCDEQPDPNLPDRSE